MSLCFTIIVTIAERFVEDKIEQEKRDAEDIRKGIVKFRVDMSDQTGESVAVATILTMVKFRDQQG